MWLNNLHQTLRPSAGFSLPTEIDDPTTWLFELLGQGDLIATNIRELGSMLTIMLDLSPYFMV